MEEAINQPIECANDLCDVCIERLTAMRKTAVRWLYMEWYKRDFLGQTVVSIHDLAPSLLRLLWANHCEAESYDGHPCRRCATPIESLISDALAPLPQAFDMYAHASRSNAITSPGTSAIASQVDQQPRSPMVARHQQAEGIPCSLQLTPRDATSDDDGPDAAGMTAASFFARAALRLSLKKKASKRSQRSKTKHSDKGPGAESVSASSASAQLHTTNFRDLVMRSPPHAPPSLFKFSARKAECGKARVMLKLSNASDSSEAYMRVEPRRKQLVVHQPDATIKTPHRSEKAPKLYSFDTIFDRDAALGEICSGSLVDLLHTVANGNDAVLLSFGYPQLGKTSTMMGSDDQSSNMGLVPCAISWLYQLIEDRKERTGARFSVRVSAVEVVGKSENLKDLLADQGRGSTTSINTSPSVYLPRDKGSNVQLSDFTEMRAPTAEKASYLLDASLAAREATPMRGQQDASQDPDEHKNSHMIFTLHVYQYLVDKVGTGEVHGGRSRLHLVDLSGCQGVKRNARDQAGDQSWLTLSALGSVIVALTNGAKHIPHKDSKLVSLLRESMGSLSARVSLVTHVSSDPSHYPEAIATLQLATRIHRSRRKKNTYSSTSSSGGDSSCDEMRRYRRRAKPVTPLFVTEACESDTLRDSEFASTSAAEDSCDTVIYVGPKGDVIDDHDLTDFERPPSVKERLDKITRDIGSDCENEASTGTTDCTRSQSTQNEVVTAFQSEPTPSALHDPAPTAMHAGEATRSHLATAFYAPLSPLVRRGSRESVFSAPERGNLDAEVTPGFVSRGNVSLPYATPYSSRRRLSNNSNVNRTYAETSVSLPATPCLRSKDDRAHPSPYKQVSDSSQSVCSMSSQASVESFERRLVSKISERFAVEEELLYVASVLTPSPSNMVSDALQCPLDKLLPLQTTTATTAIAVEATSAHSTEDIHDEDDGVVVEDDDTLSNPDESQQSAMIGDRYVRRPSMESIREQIEATGCCMVSGRDLFGSVSSCGSLIGSPKTSRKLITGPSSEGISSGYESMRCESNGNLQMSSETPNQRRKITKETSTAAIYEGNRNRIGENVSEKGRFARATNHRKKVDTLIDKREGLRSQLKQTLDKLVIGNQGRLPDVDVRLHGVSLEEPQAVRVLNRENKILARKIDVCKSHLQLVTCFDVNPSTQERSAYKVTSV